MDPDKKANARDSTGDRANDDDATNTSRRRLPRPHSWRYLGPKWPQPHDARCRCSHSKVRPQHWRGMGALRRMEPEVRAKVEQKGVAPKFAGRKTHPQTVIKRR